MGKFRQPGDPGYYTPDETFASTEPVDNLISSGYMLSPEQEAALTPEQAARYHTAYSNIRQDNQNTHNAGINAAWAQGFSSPETAPRPTDAMFADRDVQNKLRESRYDPRYPGKNISTGVDPNYIHEMGFMPKLITGLALGGMGAGLAGLLGPGTMTGTVGAGFGSGGVGGVSAGLGSGTVGAGVGSGVGGASASVPGLTGLPLGGWEQALFPSTFVPPSALEASLFPLSTAGAGSGAGLGALGVGANAGDLLNIATQSTIPKVDYITWENAERLRKGLGQVNQATAQPQQSGGSETPYVPYDTDAPVNFNEDTGVRFAAGGPIGGGLESLTAMNEGGYLDGPGDGMSDSIPATIEGEQPAALADGEFVVPADCVSHIGNGSTKAGAKRLYSMMDNLRKARTGTTQQGKQINPDNFLPA